MHFPPESLPVMTTKDSAPAIQHFLYFLGQITIKADSNPIFIITVYI